MDYPSLSDRELWGSHEFCPGRQKKPTTEFHAFFHVRNDTEFTAFALYRWKDECGLTAFSIDRLSQAAQESRAVVVPTMEIPFEQKVSIGIRGDS